MAYEITWENTGAMGVYVRYIGANSDKVVAEIVRNVQADNRFDQLRYELHDFLECDSVTHTKRTLEDIAASDVGATLTNSKFVVAVVTTRDDVRAMVQHYKDLGLHTFAFEIFQDLPSARAWIVKKTAH